MLLEIRCDKFRRGPIFFHQRLNVVIGDGNGTNSIGKSTLLMVIDFTFGGESFLKHNSDVVAELGHHYYDFAFNFGGVQHNFRRGTEHFDEILICNDNYVPSKYVLLALNSFSYVHTKTASPRMHSCGGYDSPFA